MEQKLFTKFKNEYTKIEFKIATAKLKYEIKKEKGIKFYEFITEINPNSSLKDIYKKINIFNVKKHKQKITTSAITN